MKKALHRVPWIRVFDHAVQKNEWEQSVKIHRRALRLLLRLLLCVVVWSGSPSLSMIRLFRTTGVVRGRIWSDVVNNAHGFAHVKIRPW
jgi:hypothetical protein